MALTREQKEKIVNSLREIIDSHEAMVFVDFKGLKTPELVLLREQLKKNQSNICVFKKTLLKTAFEKQGIKLDLDKLQGQVALVFSFKDKILPSKTVYGFSQKVDGLEILGGFFDNRFQDRDAVLELAELQTREELLARMVRALSSPMSGIANVLQANIRNLTFVLSVIKK